MPTPSGSVYLCSNALVDKNYTHTIDFKSPEEQLSYWGSLVKYSIPAVSYVRRQRPYIAVDYSLDDLKEINYLFYRAEENSKLYFAFVTSKEYFSENTTYVYFETDVIQTYLFDYEIKQSYVLQEHCDRWTADHKPIYSRTEESLDYGSEYTVESAYRVIPDDPAVSGIQWYVAICKPGTITGNGISNVLNVPNPYVYILLPIENSVDFFYLNDSETTIRGINAFMSAMSSTDLGEFVQQIVKVPYPPFDYTVKSGSFTTISIGGDYTVSTIDISTSKFIKVNTVMSAHVYHGYKKLAEMGVFEGIESAMPTEEQWAEIKANPYSTERDKRFESKLLTHPYRYNLLSDWRGQPQLIKNEYIGGDKIKLNFTQSLSFNSPVRYWIENYKKDPEGRGTSVLQLIPEEAPVINDNYYSYMLANKNQISANQTNAIVNTANNVAQSLVGGAIFGGGLGALGGAASGILNGAVNYQNMIRSENAKQRDLKNMPDTIINSNDGSFNIFDNNRFITLYRYKICCEFEELLADTFAMTGYTVKRLKVPNLKSRLRFNYIKTIGANIVGSFDQNDLATIKQIFDNGITFWHYNEINFKPFDYSLENIERILL